MEKNVSKLEMWDIIEKHAFLPFVVMNDLIRDKERPIILEGNGAYLIDVDGKKYIDASSGAVCTLVGYNDEKVISAIKDQVEKLPFVYYRRALNLPMIKLFRAVGELSPDGLNRVRLSVTGADANEVAVKIAKAYFNHRKNNIISLLGSYHGDTAGALALTGQRFYKEIYAQNTFDNTIHLPPPYCYRCHYGLNYPKCNILCAYMLDDTLNHHPIGASTNVAAFIGEPILGSGGIITPPDEYWPIIEEICRKHEVLLIMDEVMTGLGRTGKLFAYQHWKIKPDLVTISKGLSSMYQPISAVIFKDQIYEKLKDSMNVRFSHTVSGHPVACAAALANIERIVQDGLMQNATNMGIYLQEQLEKIAQKSPLIADVGGKGLFQRAELVKDKSTKERLSRETINKISRKCLEKGLIIAIFGYNNDTAFFTPPLIVKEIEIDEICDKFLSALKEIE